MDILHEYFKEQLEKYGYPTDAIRYSLNYSQGDGVAFYGYIDPSNFRKLAQYVAPDNFKIYDLLDKIDSGEIHLDVQIVRYGPYRYNHYNTMMIAHDCDGEHITAVDAAAIIEFVNALHAHARQISRTLEISGYTITESMSPQFFTALDGARYNPTTELYEAEFIVKQTKRFRCVIKVHEIDLYTFPYLAYKATLASNMQRLAEGKSVMYGMVAQVYAANSGQLLAEYSDVPFVIDNPKMDAGRKFGRGLIHQAICAAREELKNLTQGLRGMS